MADDSLIAVTARTCIRQIRLQDAPFILELVNSPGWIKYIGDRNVLNLADAREFLSNGLLSVYAEHGYGYYCIENLRGTPMGIAGFLNKPFLQYEDYGFALLPDYQGQGYANEASRVILDYGVREFGFTALDAVALPDNTSSIVLLDKLGFDYIRPVKDPGRGDTVSLYRRIFKP